MPEYDPDYIQLADGRVVRIDTITSLENSPAVTGRTLPKHLEARMQQSSAVTGLTSRTQVKETKGIHILAILIPVSTVSMVLLGYIMSRLA